MLNKIWLFLESLPDKFLDLFQWLFDSIYEFFTALPYWLFDLVLTVIESIIEAIDWSTMSAFESFNEWGLLPDQLLWILNYLNFSQCLTILAGAYGIRLLLNIIPAAVTRV